MRIDRITMSFAQRPQRAAAAAPVDRVDIQTRPVWQGLALDAPVPGPLGPAINQVLRELKGQGVAFSARIKPWFGQERVVELSPEQAGKRLRKGQEVLRGEVPLTLTDVAALDTLYTGQGPALPKTQLAEALHGLHQAGFSFSSDLLTAYQVLEQGGGSVRVSSPDGRWKEVPLQGGEAAVALDALEGSGRRDLLRHPEQMSRLEQLKTSYRFFPDRWHGSGVPPDRAEFWAYVALQGRGLHLQKDERSPPVPVDYRTLADPAQRVEEGTRLAREFVPQDWQQEQADFLSAVYALAGRRKTIDPHLAAECLMAARSDKTSWDSLQWNLERLSDQVPLTPDLAAGYVKAGQKPDPLLFLQLPLGTPEERQKLFVDLGSHGKLETFLDQFPPSDTVAAFRFFLLGQGRVERPELASGLKTLSTSGYTFWPKDDDRVLFSTRDQCLQAPGVYAAAPTGRVFLSSGWSKPFFPVPAEWLSTPEKIYQRAAEVDKLESEIVQCEKKDLSPLIYGAIYAEHGLSPEVAARALKKLHQLEGEGTAALWKELGQNPTLVDVWVGLRASLPPDEVRPRLHLLACQVGAEELAERAPLMLQHAPHDYIREASRRFAADPAKAAQRLTEVWLLGDQAVGAAGLAQEGSMLRVGGVRLAVKRT